MTYPQLVAKTIIHDLPNIHRKNGLRFKPAKGDMPLLKPGQLSNACWLLHWGCINRHQFLGLLDVIIKLNLTNQVR